MRKKFQTFRTKAKESQCMTPRSTVHEVVPGTGLSWEDIAEKVNKLSKAERENVPPEKDVGVDSRMFDQWQEHLNSPIPKPSENSFAGFCDWCTKFSSYMSDQIFASPFFRAVLNDNGRLRETDRLACEALTRSIEVAMGNLLNLRRNIRRRMIAGTPREGRKRYRIGKRGRPTKEEMADPTLVLSSSDLRPGED